MRRRWSLLSLVLLAVLPACHVAASDTGMSLDEYRRELRDLAQKIDSLPEHPEQAAAIETSLPDTIPVSTTSGDVSVNCHDLKNDLAAFSRAGEKKREALSSQLKNYVHSLEEQAGAYDQSNTDATAARGKLASILSRREFRQVNSGPSPLDILRMKIRSWILQLLSRLPRAAGRFDWFQVFIYAVVSAALAVLLFWTILRLRSRPEDLPREIIPFAPSARSWRVWLADARALAQREDWRGAIHLAYWAGISFLEEHGSWRPNRARTPREYLRLITSRNPNYPALAFLTRKFEIVWYGRNEARESDFQETLGQLEKLGCR